MSTLTDIKSIQDRLFHHKLKLYASRQQIGDIQRQRRNQLEALRGQLSELEEGADQLEARAEDLERRIAALGG